MSDVMKYARALYEAHGDKAEAEAAQRARKYQDAGEVEEAEQWRKVRLAINQLRGAHQG